MNTCESLAEKARELRQSIITTIYKAGDGHPGASLSCADIVTALYFNVMNIDPKNPQKPDRDRFVLSKGHACPAMYCALAKLGYFPESALPTLRAINSRLQGHPDMKKTPGVDFTAGSLGNGVSAGLGMALASRVTKNNYNVFVITGDGELEEGTIWEAAHAAAHYKVGNLTVFVDNNGLQSGGKITEMSGITPIAEKWASFGWHVQSIDGHDFEQILSAIENAKKVTDQPSVIVAKTTKGKGVSYMENNNAWHKGTPTEEQWKQAMKDLGGETNE